MSIETESWEIIPRVLDVSPYRGAIRDHYLDPDYEQNPGDILDVAPGLVEDILAGPAADLGKRYLGDFLIPTFGLLVRDMQDERTQALPWHTDIYAFPSDWQMLNCWTLLDPDNMDGCRRLELIPGATNIPKETNPSHPTKGWIESDHKQVDDLIAERGTVLPDIRAGDGIAFTGSVLHRTKWGPNPRVALEFRMVSITDAVLAEYAQNGQTVINSFDR